jgi:endonuclease YncB( thermonuclease family)
MLTPRERRMFEASARIWMAGAIALSMLSLAFGAHAKEIRGVATILSGDVVSVNKQKIRLFGIEAPSKGQSCQVNAAIMRCGIVSWGALIKIADGAFLSCDIEKNAPKKPGVIFATCYAGEHDIAEEHVRSGWAKAVATQTERYKVDEDDAKQSNRGLWAGEIIPDKKDPKEAKASDKQIVTPKNAAEKTPETAKPQNPDATQDTRKVKKPVKKKASKGSPTPKKTKKVKKAKTAAPKKKRATKAKQVKKVKKAKKSGP